MERHGNYATETQFDFGNTTGEHLRDEEHDPAMAAAGCCCCCCCGGGSEPQKLPPIIYV